MKTMPAAYCEDCGKSYPVDSTGIPRTDRPYTCDDGECSGYVNGDSGDE